MAEILFLFSLLLLTTWEPSIWNTNAIWWIQIESIFVDDA